MIIFIVLFLLYAWHRPKLFKFNYHKSHFVGTFQPLHWSLKKKMKVVKIK